MIIIRRYPMNKLIKIFVSLFLGVIIAFGISGCETTDTPSGDLPEEETAGSFYTLQEAYDIGWLTQEDLMNIAYYNNGGRTDNEEIMSETYQPVPKTPEVLSEPVAKSIKKAWAKRYNGDNTNQATDITEEMVYISEYYGTYKDCVAVIADRSDAQYVDVYAPVPVEIGGVTFIFQLYRPEILVCKF